MKPFALFKVAGLAMLTLSLAGCQMVLGLLEGKASNPSASEWVAGHTQADGVWTHRFAVVAGKTYYLNWDDGYEGSGRYSLDIILRVTNDQDTTILDNLTQVDISGDLDSGYCGVDKAPQTENYGNFTDNTVVFTVPDGVTQLTTSALSFDWLNGGYLDTSGSFAVRLSLTPLAGFDPSHHTPAGNFVGQRKR